MYSINKDANYSIITRCLTCSNGVNTCSECMDGFQVDDNTTQCIAVLPNRVLGLALSVGTFFGVLTLVLVIAAVIVIAALVFWRKKVK